MGFAQRVPSAIVLACIMVGSACNGSAPDTAALVPATDDASGVTPGPDSDSLANVLDVEDVVDIACPGSPVQPPADFANVLDVVALPASPSYPTALQTAVRDAEDGTVFYFAKTGLWWRGDATFEIVVPVELRSVMAIGWGGPAQPAHTVRGNCERSESWMVTAGGYWVREPMCAELLVRDGDNEQRVSIGLGTPCPGQDPPIGPSDG